MKPWHVGVAAAVAWHALLVALVVAAASCGHYSRSLNATHQEASRTRWAETTASAKSETTAASTKTAAKRNRKSRYLRPDGTAWKETIDEVASVSESQSASAAVASASKQATVDSTSSSASAKQEDVKRWTRPWWHYIAAVAPFALLLGWAWRRWRPQLL